MTKETNEFKSEYGKYMATMSKSVVEGKAEHSRLTEYVSYNDSVKVTVQFERCFRLMEHISGISCRNPINLHIYIIEKLILKIF